MLIREKKRNFAETIKFAPFVLNKRCTEAKKYVQNVAQNYPIEIPLPMSRDQDTTSVFEKIRKLFIKTERMLEFALGAVKGRLHP